MDLDDNLVDGLEFVKTTRLNEQFLIKDHQPNNQNFIESRDSGFSFERSYSPNKTAVSTKLSRSKQLTNNETLGEQLYKVKTIRKRSHRVRRQFKLNSLDCSFDNSLDLNTISSVDSKLTETENSFELNDVEELKTASFDDDLNNENILDDNLRSNKQLNVNQSDSGQKEIEIDGQKTDLKSISSQKNKKSTGYLISKDEFKKRISSDNLNFIDENHQPIKSKRRSKNRSSNKKIDYQTSSKNSASLKTQSFEINQNSKSLSSASLILTDESNSKYSNASKTLNNLKNQMLDIVNSVSKAGHIDCSDKTNRSIRNLNNQFINQQQKDRNTPTVTTKTTNFNKVYLHQIAISKENSFDVRNKKQPVRHYYNGY